MTAYYTDSAGYTTLAIRAVTYEIRITKVKLFCYAGGVEVVLLTRHEGSTLSGGTLAADIVPLHQGAPLPSTTGLVGSAVTTSGTSKIVGSAFVPTGNSTTVIGTTVITKYPGSNAEIQSPLTLTVAPGSVLHVTGISSGTIAQIFFEELRLPGSY